jgi:tetratricopeptide (TPR) repeat protein
MRKGRSQRKSRGSLPPLSTRPHPSSAPAGADSAPRSRGPQVVIGLTGPRSDEETRESRAPETSPISRSAASQAAPKLEILAEPTLELVREAERLELVREQSLELVRDAQQDEGEREHEYEEELAVALAQAEAQAEAVDSLAGVEREAVSDPFARALTEDTPLPIEIPSLDLVPAAIVVAPAVHTPTLLTPDEMSIPPMGDLAVEPIAERFFSEGELVAARTDDDEAWEPAQDKVKRKSHPHVVERRQRFSRYVRWAVGGAAVVCLAALARTTLMPHRAPVAKAAAAQLVKPAEPVVAAAPVAPAPEAVVAPTVAIPKAEEPKAEEPKAVEAAKPADAPKADETKPATAVATGDKTALQEKNDARRNLERGKLADAIAAGERSVALDPQDGEAWLLLGAAYQEKGNRAEARRCYTACVKEGKRGPLGECGAMMR